MEPAREGFVPGAPGSADTWELPKERVRHEVLFREMIRENCYTSYNQCHVSMEISMLESQMNMRDATQANHEKVGNHRRQRSHQCDAGLLTRNGISDGTNGRAPAVSPSRRRHNKSPKERSPTDKTPPGREPS
ncbi:hypothetical protein EVAR_81602_1 [Eumeta japonica]|uniref:Uncharacterized protein n=1 Tax=Eumeta variegata TaxID=151549 RepID=A0A4C1WEX5_EUMVA|nr:hypothetical protein EVAR_81602_1 [Eumeta japonica]